MAPREGRLVSTSSLHSFLHIAPEVFVLRLLVASELELGYKVLENDQAAGEVVHASDPSGSLISRTTRATQRTPPAGEKPQDLDLG